MSPLRPDDRQSLLRWRLALGPAAESLDPRLALADLAPPGDEGTPAMDDALNFVYERRKGGLGASRPYVPHWLSALRELFREDVVAMVQRDAIHRQGLTELLLEPETLPYLERNVELASMLVSAKHLVPDSARDTARAIIREIVEDLRRRLVSSLRSSVLGAMRRDRHGPLRTLKNLDWRRTIRTNLRHWDASRKRLVPSHLHFWANQQRHHAWDVVLLVDQSGSMADSVVHSAVMAAIFASLGAVRTHLVLFDTDVADVTHLAADPVDVLFAAQLGGGTDINRAVAYAQERLIERPERTLLILVTDLYEGGDEAQLLARVRQLAESRVRVLCLLALTDRGRPAHNHALARDLASLDVPCFTCTPRRLPEVVGQAMARGTFSP